MLSCSKNFVSTRERKKAEKFIFCFNDKERAILMHSFSCGVTVDEMKDLGIAPGIKFSRRLEAALFARRIYNWPHEIAKRIVTETFLDDQVDVIMSLLLLPIHGFSSEKILNEILYAKFSAEEMVEWLNHNTKIE